MRKIFFNVIFYFIVFVVLVFVASEIYCRKIPDNSNNKLKTEAFQKRLWIAWLDKENTNPLLPPYKLFANKGFDSPERLDFVVRGSSLPKNSVLTSYDFLRKEEIRDETYYTATINNLGFRDPPRTIQKPENTFRIIALGSYKTFGHAVDDEDTYPRQLERMLNSIGAYNLNYEVWNGGLHASTAIEGLARLKREVMAYKPDLLIYEYGGIDRHVLGDDTMPLASLFSDKGSFRFLSGFIQLTKKIIVGKSALFSQVIFYLHHKYQKENIENYKNVTNSVIEFTQDNNIPIILITIRSNLQSLNHYYQNLCGSNRYDHVFCTKLSAAYNKYPPSEKMKKIFFSRSNWLFEDYGDTPESRALFNYPEYKADFIQPNRWGYRAFARHLADKIRMLFDEDSLLIAL